MYFEDIAVGMRVELDPAVIERGRMLDFARLYDNIPLHTDEEYAKTTRFGGLIAPGLMSFLCVWAKFLEKDLFGDELIAGKSTRVEWLRPVYAGDTLTGVVTVSRLSDRNAHSGEVELTLEARNQHGKLVLTDVTEAVVKKRGAAR